MKKNLFFALMGSLLFLASCSNDFEVAAPWKDIPVVYGLLNIQDPVHYIRLEKAFLDPDASALDIAQIADSLYYQNATVELEKLGTGERFTLERVDGNLIGLPRDSGIFASSPNWLYKIDSSQLKLGRNDEIRLIINRNNGLPEVTATTSIIDTSLLSTPTTLKGIGFNYNLDTDIEWSSPEDARIFDVKLIFHYAEFNTDNPTDIQEKAYEWVWAQGYRVDFPESVYRISKIGKEFYQLLQQNLEVNPKIKRIIQPFEVQIIAGGEELEKYVNVSLANSGSITSSQELPIYTNLSEGRGIFSSINYRINKGIQLRQDSRDSLRMGIYTKDLNFQ